MYGIPHSRRLLRYLHKTHLQAPEKTQATPKSPHHYHVPLHVTACSKPKLVCGVPVQVPDSRCDQGGSCQSVQPMEAADPRPAKKRKLFKRPVKEGARVGGTECGLEKHFDKVGLADNDKMRKERKGRSKSKTNYRRGEPTRCRMWQHGYVESRHPGDSSSEDERLGWSEPGQFLRNMFALPPGYMCDEGRTDTPSGYHIRTEGSPIRNEEDDA